MHNGCDLNTSNEDGWSWSGIMLYVNLTVCCVPSTAERYWITAIMSQPLKVGLLCTSAFTWSSVTKSVRVQRSLLSGSTQTDGHRRRITRLGSMWFHRPKCYSGSQLAVTRSTWSQSVGGVHARGQPGVRPHHRAGSSFPLLPFSSLHPAFGSHYAIPSKFSNN